MTSLPDPPSGHWFGLISRSTEYWKYTACSSLNQDVRYYDDTTNGVPAPGHGAGICTIDCLLPHKNAILQLLFPPDNQSQSEPACVTEGVPPSTCKDLLLSEVGDRFSPTGGFNYLCNFYDFLNFQAYGIISRERIKNVTSDRSPGSNNLNILPLYTPSIDGSIVQMDSVVTDWILSYTDDKILNSSYTYILLNDCTLTNDLGSQDANINYARDLYRSIFGNIVGPSTLNVIPTALDKKPSQWRGAQYVMDISATRVCPAIDDLCKSLTMGKWVFGLTKAKNASELMANLPSNFCRNQTLSAQPPPPGYAYVGDLDPTTATTFMAGYDPTFSMLQTIDPISTPNYIARSCQLAEYDSLEWNCCANDFADQEGAVIFNPLSSQPPTGINPTNSIKPIFFSYDYETNGSPQYRYCFDSTGVPCNPSHRDITGDSCSRLMFQHCIAIKDNSVDASWSRSSDGSGECTKWLGRLLYGDQGQWIEFANAIEIRGVLKDYIGTKLTSEILVSMAKNFTNYFTIQEIADTGAPKTPLGRAVEPVLFTLYKNYNLILQDGGYLLTQCGRYGISDVLKNPLLRKWCGCVLNPEEYAQRYPEIPIECTPMCNSSDVIQYSTQCQGTECVIDGVTLSLVESQTQGLSITQVCQACGNSIASDTTKISQTCTCVIDNTVITAVQSYIGNISINEMCGVGSTGPAPPNPSNQTPAEKFTSAGKIVISTFPYDITIYLVVLFVTTIFLGIVSQMNKDKGQFDTVRQQFTTGAIIALVIIIIATLFAIGWQLISRTVQ